MGAPELPALLLAADIRQRASALIRWWGTPDRRDVLLLPAIEEATFYEPSDTPLLVRALVVFSVRNSRLEDAASTVGAAQSLGLARPLLDDWQMREITSAAVHAWAQVPDLAALAGDVRVGGPTGAPAARDFDSWPERFPLAWGAISAVVTSERKGRCEASYRSRRARPPQSGRSRVVAPARNPRGRTGPRPPAPPRVGAHMSGHTQTVVGSGMNAELPVPLREILESIEAGDTDMFFSDCFKTIARHPAILWTVLERALAAGGTVLTQNYLLCDGYVARRQPLLHPSHTTSEANRKFANPAGLVARHRSALAGMAAAMSEPSS